MYKIWDSSFKASRSLEVRNTLTINSGYHEQILNIVTYMVHQLNICIYSDNLHSEKNNANRQNVLEMPKTRCHESTAFPFK